MVTLRLSKALLDSKTWNNLFHVSGISDFFLNSVMYGNVAIKNTHQLENILPLSVNEPQVAVAPLER